MKSKKGSNKQSHRIPRSQRIFIEVSLRIHDLHWSEYFLRSARTFETSLYTYTEKYTSFFKPTSAVKPIFFPFYYLCPSSLASSSLEEQCDWEGAPTMGLEPMPPLQEAGSQTLEGDKKSICCLQQLSSLKLVRDLGKGESWKTWKLTIKNSTVDLRISQWRVQISNRYLWLFGSSWDRQTCTCISCLMLQIYVYVMYF